VTISRGLIALALLFVVVACGTTPAASSPSPQPASSSTPVSAQSPATTGIASQAGGWTELRWSSPVATPEQGSLFDVVIWRDAYVAVGQASVQSQYVGAAFVSADGVHWERTAAFSVSPGRLVVTNTRLIALGVRADDPRGTRTSVVAWTSRDGRAWQPEAGLAISDASITQAVARGDTVVAVGSNAGGAPAMWRSVDSGAWQRVPPPSSNIVLRSVVTVTDGFLAAGRDGEPDQSSGGVGTPGVGRPAAWWSADGLTWSPVQVEGAPAAGAQLLEILRIATGYVALGSDATNPSENPRSPQLWVSADAHDWRLVGPPPHWPGALKSNGKQAIILGVARASDGTTTTAAWVSVDGRQWSQLSFGGDLVSVPVPVSEAGGRQPNFDRFFAEPNGILVLGQQRGDLSTWFAEAVVH